jgi:uncharacterized protein YkwD
MLLIGLIIIYLFYLLRPPFLMFWCYDLKRCELSAERPPQTPLGSSPERRVTLPPLIKAPPVPLPLSQPVATWSPAPPSIPGTDALDQEIEKLTNQVRQKYARPNLEIDSKLRQIATRHSWDMLEKGYMDHISPDGVGPAQRVGKQHRRLFGLTGENVASIDSPPGPTRQMAERFVESWMNSPGHRRNILSADYNRMATGCYQQQNGAQDERRCTQLFVQAYALAEQDIPETVTAGQTLTLRIRPLPGLALPTRLVQVNLRNGAEPASAPLTASGDVAVGQITLHGPPGVYILQLHMLDQQDSSRYWIVPGPYITVSG